MRLCVETYRKLPLIGCGGAAAFVRLCVETLQSQNIAMTWRAAAFVRLCVETARELELEQELRQPPSCGCVLKPASSCYIRRLSKAAAFVRLCVETAVFRLSTSTLIRQPPSCGCVLKLRKGELNAGQQRQPPSCGCVLKQNYPWHIQICNRCSRLRAAVC